MVCRLLSSNPKDYPLWKLFTVSLYSLLTVARALSNHLHPLSQMSEPHAVQLKYFKLIKLQCVHCGITLCTLSFDQPGLLVASQTSVLN